MLKEKNAFIAIAVTLLLAACGGGGGGDSDSNAASGPSTGTSTQPVADKELAGQLTLVNQVIANGKSFSLDTFEGNTPATCQVGLFGQAQGTNGAPLQNFGLKVMPELTPVADASGNGHIAIEIMDPAANSPQQFQIMIDRVDYKVSRNAPTLSATVARTAKAFVHVKSGGGTADVVVDSLPADVVAVAELAAPEDPSFRTLVVDIDKIFAAAKAKVSSDAAKTAALNGVLNFKGTFNMNATFSALNIVRSGQTGKYPGADIGVSGQPAVKGAGVKGKLWVRDIPAPPCNT